MTQITKFTQYPKDLIQKAQEIKLIIFDVDGVFTDGCLHINAQGEISKVFHAQDGFGIIQLHKLNVEMAVISGRADPCVDFRMKQLKIKVDNIFLCAKNKLETYETLIKKLNLTDSQVAFVGDDLPDVQVMGKVGLPIATQNATPYIKHISKWITPHEGGKGAVRDVCDLFIQVNKNQLSNNYEN